MVRTELIPGMGQTLGVPGEWGWNCLAAEELLETLLPNREQGLHLRSACIHTDLLPHAGHGTA